MPNLPYQTAGWNTHSQVAYREIDYPLAEVCPTHFTVLRTYEGPYSTYSPLALDTADAEFSSAKFVRQGPLQDVGGSCVRYTRLFATVPASWSDAERFAFTFPAYVIGISFGSPHAVTAITAGSGTYVLSTTATDISFPGSVYVDLAFTRNGSKYRVSFRAEVVSVVAGTSVTIGNLLQGSGAFSAVSGTVRYGTQGRTLPLDQIVPSRLLSEYVLTSDAAVDTDLPILEKWSPVNSSGYETQFLSTGTATYPNSNDYSDMIRGGTEVIAERSDRRRYLGNIWVRTTRLVKAA